MHSKKKLIVLFPYITNTNEVHSWITNRVMIFQKLGFRVEYYKLSRNDNKIIRAIAIFYKMPLSFLKIHSADIVLIPTSYLMFLPISIARLMGKKVFIAHLSTLPDPSLKLPLSNIIKFATRASDRFSFKLSNHILTFTETIAKKISTAQKIQFNDDKFFYKEVIDTDLFKPRHGLKDKVKRELGLASEFVFFYHGHYHPWHGLDYFISAFKTLYKKNKNIRLIILSFPDGREHEYLDHSIVNHPGIIFLPEMRYRQLAKYIQVTDLWVGRFKHHVEGDAGFSICSVEALSCGKPVLTYDSEENLKVIKDGENGFIVRAESPRAILHKIIPLLSKGGRGRLTKMSVQARKTAIENFSNRYLFEWIRNKI